MGKPSWLFPHGQLVFSSVQGCKGQKHSFLSTTIFRFFKKIFYIENPTVYLIKLAASKTTWCPLPWQTGRVLIKNDVLHRAVFTDWWVLKICFLTSEAETPPLFSCLWFPLELQQSGSFTDTLQSWHWLFRLFLHNSVIFLLDYSCPNCRVGHFS